MIIPKKQGGKVSKTLDMTRGPISRQLLLFALPLLASSLIQQLYNTVNLIFVSQFLDKEASAAVGTSSMLVTCLVGFFTGMSLGASVIAAGHYGAKNKRALKNTIHTSMAIALAGGLLLTILGLLLAPTFLQWMKTPASIMPLAVSYIRVYFLSLIPLITYNVGSGILRALGDSKSPMIYQLAGGIINIAANAFFIVQLNWGINGSALASFFAQALAAALVFYHLSRLDPAYALNWKQIGMESKIATSILNIGVPAGVQATATTFSNIFIQTYINTLGVDVIAAFTAYFRVELFIYLPIIAFSQAATTFVGQNIGAGEIQRVKKGIRTGILLGGAFTLALSALTLFFSNQLFSFFTSDSYVADIGISLAWVAFPFYFLYVFLEIFAAGVRGAGKATPPMIIVLVNICGVRLILLWFFVSIWPSPQSVAMIYPVTWLISALAMAAYYRFGRWLPS